MQSTAVGSLASRFMDLFAGSQSSYGIYDVSSPERRDDGKLTGRAITKHAAVTLDLWEDHLAGVNGIGIVPIRDDATCVFGAIDIDSYSGLDHRAIVNKLQTNDIPLIVCRSKSGGAHLYCFSQTPVSAAKMKIKLSEVAALLGHGNAEIFPKQTALLLERGDLGSWLNICYFNGVRGMRYAVESNGNALSPEAFLVAAEAMKVDEAWFDKPLILADIFPDGPPCLQALVQIGFPTGTRNSGLFNIAVYLRKARPDQWQVELDSYNHRLMQPPLTIPEVQSVIKSVGRKEYIYSCTKSPIAQHCQSGLCRTRKFGVGASASGRFPSLGGLSKLNTDPPVWFLMVDGYRMALTTDELLHASAFQKKCMECINTVITIPSRAVWESCLHSAMQSLTIIEAPQDSSPEGQFFEMLEKFCLGRAQAQSLEEIVLGKPHTFEGRTYFRMQDLVGFLNRAKFFEFRTPKIAAILQEHGGQHHTKAFRGRTVQHWSMPAFARQTEGFEVPKNLSERKEAF